MPAYQRPTSTRLPGACWPRPGPTAAAIGVMHPGRVDVIGGGALILDRIMERFGFSEVLVSEHDILDGMAWSLAAGALG